MNTNTLYYGDCLDWIRCWESKSVNLIYLDPPFNSKANYNVLFGKEGGDAQYRAFDDTWYWDENANDRLKSIINATANPAHYAIKGISYAIGETGMLAYLTYMAERLIEMRRILKSNGSIYLHCDPTASHYLKIIMDAIFGLKNFRREIIWNLQTSSGYKSQVKGYVRGHDVILYYALGTNFTFNKQFLEHKSEYKERFKKQDSDGRWYRDDRPKGRRQYLDKTKGVMLTDVWSDIMSFQQASTLSEYLHYPTQKPLKLLERIISASSHEEEIVLDPFCGCGTAVVAAKNLNRKFIGIDISAFAIDLINEKRLEGTCPIKGIPMDMNSAQKLAQDNPFNFESWAISRLPGFAPNSKQVGDGGVDGRGLVAIKPENQNSDLAIAQVKGTIKFSLDSFKAFITTMNQKNALIGVYITLKEVNSPNAKILANQLGKIKYNGSTYPKLQIWSIKEYFDGKNPDLPPMKNPWTGKEIGENLFGKPQDLG